MGCLNDRSFEHWFGNIHLSGPCNRACYFCIGQHMMALDAMNNLKKWPLENIEAFVAQCKARGVKDVNLTGSNTDPLLYRWHHVLTTYLRRKLPGVKLGIRTNGVMTDKFEKLAHLYDKGSVSITSFDPKVYAATMGHGAPPDVERILGFMKELKVNVVLCPETVGGDLFETLAELERMGVRKINVREPYGQTHIGDPLAGVLERDGTVLDMPAYRLGGASVTYWDVHYVAVSSVNLFAQGRISEEYSVTGGHAPTGIVRDQSHFGQGRQQEQWLTLKRRSHA